MASRRKPPRAAKRPTSRARAPGRRKRSAAVHRPSLPPLPTDSGSVFQRLRSILREHEPRLVVKADTHGNYQLDTPLRTPKGQPLYFGGVRIGRAYVSYHLFPVYMMPKLLAGASPALKRRMQGKSCFNFARIDESVFAELAELTRRGVDAVFAAHG